MPASGFWRSKPPAGTRFDRLHPLARDLICCVPLNEGAGRPVDLVSGANGAATVAAGAGLSWVGGQDGFGLKHDNTGTGVADSGSLTFPNSASPQGQAFTFWIRYYRPSLGVLSAPIRSENPASGGFEFRVAADNTLQLLRAEQAGFTASTGTVPVGWNDIAVAHAADTTYRYYLNGQDVGGGTSSGTFTYTLRMNLGGSGSSAVAQNGSISSQMMIWNRALAAPEIASLTSDQFQLYEPPVWRRYVGALIEPEPPAPSGPPAYKSVSYTVPMRRW